MTHLYKMGTIHGTLNQLHLGNQFTVCKKRFVSVEDIPDSEISMRECVGMLSKCYSGCGSKGGYTSDRCS